MVNRVHFKKWIGIMLISAAVFGVVFPACVFFAMGIRDISMIFATGSINMIFSICFFILGLLILKKPAIIYSEDEAEIKSMIGITIKKVALKNEAIDIKGNRMYVNGKKLRMTVSSLNIEELNAFMNFIAKAKSKPQNPSNRQKSYLYN